ncbi:MAG: UPF0179 family protein [Candidatus Methanomethylophilaceae archaeon]|jgi:hypothetical protein
MVLITLVGEPTATPGSRFYYLGPLTDCKECKLRNVCFNLEQGSLYEITKIREQKHECALREEPVSVVEVEKVAVSACLPKKQAIDGSMITYQPPKCGNIGCENYTKCFPTGSEDGRKYSITEVGGNAECPEGEKMVFVKMI